MSESTPATVPLVNLAGKNFRVRAIAIIAALDLYDADGFLLERGKTGEIVINEANFPPEIVNFLTGATDLGPGFAKRAVVVDAPAT